MPQECGHVTFDDFKFYSDSEWVVIPLHSPYSGGTKAGKAPTLPRWNQAGVPSDAEIRSWVNGTPDLNMGLVTGRVNNIVAVDVDGPGGEEKLLEVSEAILPPTWEYTTSRGRRRVYWLQADVVVKKKQYSIPNRPGEELALLGDGQQIVIPPSIHPSDVPYLWVEGHEPDKQDLSPAPLWMLLAMTSGRDRKPFEALQRLAERCPLFAEDLREQQMTGLGEEVWYRWIALLCSAEQAEAALAFSQLSGKHDERSEARVREINEQEQRGMLRCTTAGCDEDTIKHCHHTLRTDDQGAVKNSPGSHLKVKQNKAEPVELTDPVAPIYEPYLRLLQGSPYRLNENGVMFFDDGEKQFRIANFVARPILETVRDDGVEQVRGLVIGGVLQGGVLLPPLNVSLQAFSGMNWINQWGIRVAIAPGFNTRDHVRAAIQHLASEASCETIYTHLGWRKVEDAWIYLHYGGCVGSDTVQVDLDNGLERYCLPDTSEEEIRSAATKSLHTLKLAPLQVSLPLLALVYLSPLCEPLRQAGIEPTFVLWLHGLTGSRKTSLAKVFLSHFGQFQHSAPPASFQDTANALELRCSLAKDALILVDDFHPAASSSDANKLASTAQRLLRLFGDRVARGRLTSKLDLRPNYIPRGMAVVTGEDLPQGHSSVARFLGVELAPEIVDLKLLSAYQANGDVLSRAMRGYIEWLRPQMEGLPLLLKERFSQIREEFQASSNHGRIGEAAAWLMVAFEQALNFFQAVGAVDTTEVQDLQDRCSKALLSLIDQQNADVASETPANLFLQAFSEMLSQGKLAPPINPNRTEKSLLKFSWDYIGWRDDNYFFLLPGPTYGAVSNYLSRQGKHLGITERALWAQFAQTKAILTERGKGRLQNTIKKTLPWGNKQRVRVLILLRSVVPLEEGDSVETKPIVKKPSGTTKEMKLDGFQ